MTTKLKKIQFGGYKSFSGSEPLEVEFGDVNIFIGANGAGKSNFVSFFKMLNMMIGGNLQEFIGRQGGANSLLHYGSKRTPILEGALDFRDENDKENAYYFRLASASQDTLIFIDENTTFRISPQRQHKKIELGAGHRESALFSDDAKQTTSLWVMGKILNKCKVYQFHDTTADSFIRKYTSIGNNDYLYSDGGNLAAFLLGMKSSEKYHPYYKRIVQWIKNIFPLFDDFILEPSAFNKDTTILRWREKGNEYDFGPHQISDGTLRFMALATLLMQPPDFLPNLLIIDEPELGLHPVAIGALAGMVQTASQHCQVILATQSPLLLDEFSPEDIIVVERDKRQLCSKLKRLSSEELKEWIKDYSLSEMWEKNRLGGQP
jgi:predicted ATPase